MQNLALGMEIRYHTAAVGVARIYHALAAVSQFCKKIHETGFLHGSPHMYGHVMVQYYDNIGEIVDRYVCMHGNSFH